LKLEYTKQNIIKGALIYSAGDAVASLLIDEFSWVRVIGMMCIGATLYAFEIPNYFKWIDSKTNHYAGTKLWLSKTILAILYFNPLWIIRHLFFIKLFSVCYAQIEIDIFRIGLYSFIVNIPISFIANFIIQNKIKLSYRFMSSAIFSALMAIYYALSLVLFKSV